MSEKLAAALRDCLSMDIHHRSCKPWREKAEEALAAHEAAKPSQDVAIANHKGGGVIYKTSEAATDAAIRAKLIELGWTPPHEAAKPAEPVAWVVKMAGGYHDVGYDSGVLNKVPHGTKLYAAPVAVASPWIPVTERLPEPETRVLATYTNELGNRRRIIAKWVPAKTVEADSEDEEGVIEYDEDKDCYWLLSGWYEQVYNWADYSAIFVNEGAVDFWQPLPPAPKEQQHAG